MQWSFIWNDAIWWNERKIKIWPQFWWLFISITLQPPTSMAKPWILPIFRIVPPLKSWIQIVHSRNITLFNADYFERILWNKLCEVISNLQDNCKNTIHREFPHFLCPNYFILTFCVFLSFFLSVSTYI